MGEDVIGGRCPSWQAMVSVKNFHRSARARPPPADTPDESSAVTTSQVTPLIQDFAVSLDFYPDEPVSPRSAAVLQELFG